MTNEEAIKVLREIYNKEVDDVFIFIGAKKIEALDLAIKALEDVTSLKRVISLLAVGGIPPEKQLIDFGYTKEDWVYMLKTVMGIIEENISCANSDDIKGDKE